MADAEHGVILTKSGYEELSLELEEILTVKKPEVVDRIREARQIGDLGENFDYEDAKRLQAMLEARLVEVRAILANARVIEDFKNNGIVDVGCRVAVRDLSDNSEEEYAIVGPAESSPAEGKISLESCVGSALMGHKEGDMVTVVTPGGKIRYEILSVK